MTFFFLLLTPPPVGFFFSPFREFLYFTRVTQCTVYVRRLDPSVLAFSLSLYRHPSICILFSSHFTSYNKQNSKKKTAFHISTPATGKARCDLEVKDYVVFQKPQEQTDHLPPPRTLIMDFTLTHT